MLIQGHNSEDDGDREEQQLTVPAAITDTGCERELNEDRYAVIESQSGVAWIVCDGMGGATGGELAAQLAIDAVRRDLEKHAARTADIALKSAIVEANRIIVLRRQNQAFASMGTTLVSVLFDGPEVVIGNVGDSRAYLVREGAIQQLTTDHTYVQQLVEKGEIKPEEALSHPQAHILTRCLGAEPGVDVDLRKYWIWELEDNQASDLIVLGSDGLYSLVSDGEIANITSNSSPQAACVKLVELAKARGGYDNITVTVIPLAGQLKQNAPPGFEKKVRKQEVRKSFARSTESSPIRQALIMGALAVTAAALTIAAFLAFRFVW